MPTFTSLEADEAESITVTTWKPLALPGVPAPVPRAPWSAPAPVSQELTPAPKKRGRPLGSKNKPVEADAENHNITLEEESQEEQAPQPTLKAQPRALTETLTQQIKAAGDLQTQLDAALEMIAMQRNVIESLEEKRK